jgi:4'-phosphopantetheinyl transferase EntD
MLTSIFLSKTKRVGIDLEKMSHKISSIGHKFINSQEIITEDPELKRYHLYIHWCAKEALYKICDKQDINFKENLTITPFKPKDKGIIEGRVLNSNGVEDFKLRYQKYKDYAIAWTCKR